MKTIMSYFISFAKDIMEARVLRLNLLMQQAERKLDIDKCCDAIRCCLDSKKKSISKPETDYYFHK